MSAQEDFKSQIKTGLANEFKGQNEMALPKIVKVVINVGAGEAVMNKNVIEKIQEQIALIAGQKPVVTKARKSISAFKIRMGMPLGVKVTLRGEKMYAFIEKLVRIVLPRIRDFRGIPESCIDGHGNLNLGFPEQTLFPEIEYDKVDKVRGLEVTIVTTAGSHENGKKLFDVVGVPFKK